MSGQGVHVGTVHIHAATVLVHQGAEFFAGLKHAVRAGVKSDHHGGEVVAVLFALVSGQPCHVALGVASGHHHRQTHNVGAGEVGADARWKESDVAVALTVGLMKPLMANQTGVLARSRPLVQADAA
jgi:hypothetical protein